MCVKSTSTNLRSDMPCLAALGFQPRKIPSLNVLFRKRTSSCYGRPTAERRHRSATDKAMTFSHPISDRYFEDYVEGDVHRFGTIAVEADEMIAFAKRFDPQTMHTDPRRPSTHPSAASSPAAG